MLRQLESPWLLPEEQLGAALAYLEVIWIEAQQRALETDGAHQTLREHFSGRSALPEKACRYHSSVRQLREVVARRVDPILTAQTNLATHSPAQY